MLVVLTVADNTISFVSTPVYIALTPCCVVNIPEFTQITHISGVIAAPPAADKVFETPTWNWKL